MKVIAIVQDNVYGALSEEPALQKFSGFV